MRFVSGGWYTGRALARIIAGPSRLPGAAAEPAPVPAESGTGAVTSGTSRVAPRNRPGPDRP